MVTVKLDRERHLSLKLRGMLLYEEMTGKSLLRGFDMKSLSTKEMAALFWACLIHEDKTLTFEQFKDIVDLGDIQGMTAAVAQCIVESFPDKEKSTEPPLANLRPGSTFGPSGGTTLP